MQTESQPDIDVIQSAIELLRRHIDWDKNPATPERFGSPYCAGRFLGGSGRSPENHAREKNHLDQQIDAIRMLENGLGEHTELMELAEEENDADLIAEAVSALQKMAEIASKKQLESLLSGEADSNNCFIEIHPGCWRYRSSGLGFHVAAYVFQMGRKPRLQAGNHRGK